MKDGNLTYVSKIHREVKALRRLRLISPTVFWTFCVILPILAFGWAWEHFWGEEVLRKKVDEQKQQIQLLETQITPFKTIALERYPGRLNEALAGLAGDIKQFEQRLKDSERKIHAIAASVKIEVGAKWKNGTIPNINTMFLMGANSSAAHAEFRTRSGKMIPVNFYGFNDIKFQKQDADAVLVSFETVGNPPFELFSAVPEDLVSLEKLELEDGGINLGMLESPKLEIRKLSIFFLLNGRLEFGFEIPELGTVELTESAKSLHSSLLRPLPLTLPNK